MAKLDLYIMLLKGGCYIRKSINPKGSRTFRVMSMSHEAITWYLASSIAAKAVDPLLRVNRKTGQWHLDLRKVRSLHGKDHRKKLYKQSKHGNKGE